MSRASLTGTASAMSCYCNIEDLGVFNAHYLCHSCPDQSRFLDMFCVIIIIAILDHADVLMCMSYVSCVVTVEESQNCYIFLVYTRFPPFSMVAGCCLSPRVWCPECYGLEDIV